MAQNHEEFLYKNFELLFSKEPQDNGERSSRLENKFSYKIKNNAESPEQDVATKQHDYFKIQFDNLRNIINEDMKAEKSMAGGNIPSLKYNCFLEVSTQKSPAEIELGADGDTNAPPLTLNECMYSSYTFNRRSAVSNHSCPSIGYGGCDVFAKFSNK